MSTVALPKLLMMHGWTQNGSVFASKTYPWPRKLKTVLSGLVYADAPHKLPLPPATMAAERADTASSDAPDTPLPLPGGEAPSAAAGSGAGAGTRPDPRAWWLYNEKDALDTSDFLSRASRPYYGWHDSLASLAELHAREGPFQAMCGFSQGAVALHNLLLEMQAEAEGAHADAGPDSVYAQPAVRALLRSPPACAIFVCGFPSAAALTAAPASGASTGGPAAEEARKLRIPSLHVVSPQDGVVPYDMHVRLAECFDAPVLLTSDRGHTMPQRAGEMAAIAEFIRKHTAA